MKSFKIQFDQKIYFVFVTFFLPVTKAVMHLTLKILSCVSFSPVNPTCSPPNPVCLLFLLENAKIPLPGPPQPHPKNLQKIFQTISLENPTCLPGPSPCSLLQTQHLWHSCKLVQASEQSQSHLLGLPQWNNCKCSQLSLQCYFQKGWVSQRKLCLLAFACFRWTPEAQSSIVFLAGCWTTRRELKRKEERAG